MVSPIARHAVPPKLARVSNSVNERNLAKVIHVASRALTFLIYLFELALSPLRWVVAQIFSPGTGAPQPPPAAARPKVVDEKVDELTGVAAAVPAPAASANLPSRASAAALAADAAHRQIRGALTTIQAAAREAFSGNKAGYASRAAVLIRNLELAAATRNTYPDTDVTIMGKIEENIAVIRRQLGANLEGVILVARRVYPEGTDLEINSAGALQRFLRSLADTSRKLLIDCVPEDELL